MKAQLTLELESAATHEQDRVVIRWDDQEDIQLHDHHFFELVYITNGSTEHILNGHHQSLREGQYCMIDYGSEHAYNKSKDLRLINCLFLPEVIDATLKGCESFEELIHQCLLRYYRLYKGQSFSNRIFDDENRRIYGLLQDMLREYEEKKVGYTDIIRNNLLEILLITMRKIMDTEAVVIEHTMVTDIIDYIQKNYTISSPITQFSKEKHYSLPYISRKFKEEMGITPRQYVQKIRIEKSCVFLAGSTLNITEIAENVGYKDIKSFNQLFRKMTGMSPSEFRKKRG